MKLVNKAGVTVDVPVDQVQAAFRSGEFGLPAGAEIPIVNGRTMGTVSAENFEQAMRDGATIAPEADFRQAQGENSSALGAFGAGALRGAGSTVLLPTDKIATSLGGAFLDPKDYYDPYLGHVHETGDHRVQNQLLQWQEGHPYASTAGEVAGMAAGTAATEGLGGATALGRAGSIAERGAQAFGAGKVLTSAAKLGAESALLGGVNTVNESALGDTELTASKMFHGVFESGVMGGLGGAAFGGAGKAAKGFSEWLARAPAAEAIESAAERQFGEAAPGVGEKVRQALVKLSGVASGKAAEDIEPFIQPTAGSAEARAIATGDHAAIHQNALHTVVDEGNKFGPAVRALSDENTGVMKARHVAADISDNAAGQKEAVGKWAQDVVNGANAQIQIGDLAPGVKSGVKSAMDRAVAIQEMIAKDAPAHEIYMAVDEAKRVGQQISKAVRRVASDTSGMHDPLSAGRAASWLGDSSQETRALLENANVWGKVGEDQAVLNKLRTRFIAAEEQFKSDFMIKRADDSVVMNPSAVDSHLKQVVNPARDLKSQSFREYIDSAEALSKGIAERYKLAPSELHAVESGAAAMRKAVQNAERKATVVNQFKSLMGSAQGTIASGVGGAVLGSVLGRDPLEGGALGLTMGALRSPGNVIRTLAAVERMAMKSDSRIASALRSFMSGGAPRTAATGISDIAGEKFEKVVGTLQKLSTQPDAMIDHSAAALGDLGEGAPKLSAAVSGKLSTTVAFLAAKIPPGMHDNSDMFMGKQPPMVSDTERETFARYVKAASDPASVVERAAAGQVTLEEADTLRALHPALYAEVKTSMLEKAQAAATAGNPLSYPQLVTMNTLFGVQTDSSTNPVVQAGVLTAAQNVSGLKNGGGKQAVGGGTFSRMKEPHFLSSMMTATQRMGSKGNGK